MKRIYTESPKFFSSALIRLIRVIRVPLALRMECL